ncbi:MAG: DM13 domain-containing protein [Hyphomicrobiales bacterium]
MSISRRQFATLALSAAAVAAMGTSTASAGSARKGTFTGHKGYTAKGTVKIKKDGGKTSVVLGDDFLFKGTPPDIKIGFGNGGKYAKGTKIHNKLTHKKGAATFPVPAGIDTDKYNEVYIYCEKFTVILGTAKIK